MLSDAPFMGPPPAVFWAHLTPPHPAIGARPRRAERGRGCQLLEGHPRRLQHKGAEHPSDGVDQAARIAKVDVGFAARLAFHAHGRWWAMRLEAVDQPEEQLS
jgi:hypothetical protein